ncbi:hypothetical protein [Streptomyces sp. b94]|nr:hypothetical protein [Streptomyces sp. b94]
MRRTHAGGSWVVGAAAAGGAGTAGPVGVAAGCGAVSYTHL